MIKHLTKKAGFILAVAGAAIVGGASTALVTAAIPSSSDDKVHACYRNSGNILNPKGSLRVVDSDNNEGCTPQETALSWSKNEATDAPIASGVINGDGSIDSTSLTNIASYTEAGTSVSSAPGYCFDLAFEPKVSVVSVPNSIYFKDTPPEGEFEQHCSASYDMFIASSSERVSFFVR